MKIGILYIATGPYFLFWENFYKNVTTFFLPEIEKEFYVFTNVKTHESNNENVHFYTIDHMPWPLITLLRFHTFLTIENEICKCDYLYYFNANLGFARTIESEEILPKKGSRLVFTTHPGYFCESSIYAPFERKKQSKAYLPYKKQFIYVIGAFFGGEATAFISMCKVLKDNIESDFKHNIIARWHDESHLNWYAAHYEKACYLHPGYCYPLGFDIEYEKVIYSLDKQAVFDINMFKGYSANFEREKNVIKRIYKGVRRRIIPVYMRAKCKLHFCSDRFLKIEYIDEY